MIIEVIKIDKPKEPQIKATCHDNGKIDFEFDEPTFDWFNHQADLAGMPLEEYMKQVIEDGIKSDMTEEGYTYEGMTKIPKEMAMSLFNADERVYLLYPDNTEGEAESINDIEKHDYEFGIELKCEQCRKLCEHGHDTCDDCGKKICMNCSIWDEASGKTYCPDCCKSQGVSEFVDD